MIKRSILILTILLGYSISAHAACTGSSPTLTAASASYAEVKLCVDIAVDGDTINIPTDTKTWTQTLTITHAITLHGNGVGNTIILDNADGVDLIDWTCVSGKAHRMTGIEFQDGGYSPRAFSGRIKLICYSTPSTTFRIDHNKFDHLADFPFYTYDVIGVADHNTFLASGSTNPFYIFDPSWKGVGVEGDNSMATATTTSIPWGSTDSFFIEDNTFTWDAGTTYLACLDGYYGMRAVARFNTTTGCAFEMHGTETGQRHRGSTANEIYNNTMDAGGDPVPPNQPVTSIADIRSGAMIAFDNVMTNVPVGYSNYRFANIVDDRTTFLAIPWGNAAGKAGIDVNDGMNPYETCGNATAVGSLTVTCGGKSWATDFYAGYSIAKTNGCSKGACPGSVIISNTPDTITFASADNHGDLSFSTSDTFEINKVTETFDQPGRAGGTLLVNKTCSSITSVATLATATCASHGFANLSWVIMNDNAAGYTPYTGFYQITVLDGDTFTYTCYTTCGSSTSGQANLSPASNDQTDFPTYEINNTLNGVLRHINRHTSCVPSCRENEHYYSYVGPQSGAGTPFDGSVGTGRGTRAQRPAAGSSTNGVAYFSTDAGGNWNTLGGGANDGCLDVMVSGAWVNCWYTPADYPSIYQGAVCTPDHLAFILQPSGAVINAVLGTVRVGVYDSGDVLCDTATNTVTIANKGGTCTGMTLGGTKSGAASSGLFDTTDLFENAAGACTLSATASGLTGADSDAFTISAIAVGNGGFGLHGR